MQPFHRTDKSLVVLLSVLLSLGACSDSTTDQNPVSQTHQTEIDLDTWVEMSKERQAQRKQIPDTYATRFTAAGRQAAGLTGTYSKDPNVWVYTSAFAKRFGMPEQWIDDDLNGAEAVAYRIDWDVFGISCGYFGELETCRPSSACVLDFYVPDSAALPWNTTTRYESYYGRKSNGYFVPQNDNDKPGYLSKLAQRGRHYHVGLDDVGHRSGITGNNIMGSFFVLEFDRDIYRGLEYFSGATTCGAFGRARHVKTHIYQPQFYPDGAVDPASEDIAHTIEVPNSFMRRVSAHDAAAYEPSSVFQELKQRLSTTTQGGE